MTTIVRYKDHVVCDSRYMSLIGDGACSLKGPPKIFRNATNTALIAVSGAFSNKGVFDVFNADINQAIIDLLDYPNIVPAFKQTIAFYSNEENKKNGTRDQVPTVLIATKEWSCVFISDDSKPNEPMIAVYPAAQPISLGTGTSSMLPLLDSIKGQDSIIKALQISLGHDCFSGNELYYCSIEPMGEMK